MAEFTKTGISNQQRLNDLLGAGRELFLGSTGAFSGRVLGAHPARRKCDNNGSFFASADWKS
jgi:hypothetical protein